jgi:WD40 repeat protein
MTARSMTSAMLAGLALLAVSVGPGWAQTIQSAGEPISLSQSRAVTSLDIDPRGETLAVSGLDGAVRLWSLTTGAAGPVFPVHDGDAAAVRFTTDGRRLLTTGSDGQAVLLQADAGTRIRTWRFPTWCLGLTVVDADTAAVGCADLKIRVLNLGDDAIVREIQSPGSLQYQYIGSLSASPDGRLLASNNPLTLYDVETGEQRATVSSFAQRVVFSPDGQSLLSGSMKAGASVMAVDPLQARAQMVTDVEQRVQTPSGRQAVRQGMPIYGVVWSPDGRFFATGGLDRLVRIWRLQDGGDPVEVTRLEGHDSAISALAWHGDHLVSGDLGGHIRIWRLTQAD